MSSVGPKRKRSQRVAALQLTPGWSQRLAERLRQPGVPLRLGLTVLALVAIWAVSPAFTPPFTYRLGYVPNRDVTARVAFDVFSREDTQQARDAARRQSRCIYVQDPEPLVQLRATLRNRISQLVSAPQTAEEDLKTWREFLPPRDGQEMEDTAALDQLKRFREMLMAEGAMTQFEQALEKAFQPLEQQGYLRDPHPPEEGNQKEIFVYRKGDDPSQRQLVQLNQVLVGEAGGLLLKRMREELGSEEMAGPPIHWLRQQLAQEDTPVTLSLDKDQTLRAREEAIAAVEPKTRTYEQGRTLVKQYEAIGPDDLELLRLEYLKYSEALPIWQRLGRSAAMFALISAVFLLCGCFLALREARYVQNTKRLAAMLTMTVATLLLTRLLMEYRGGEAMPLWHAELLPLLLLGLTLTVAYSQQLALVITAAVAVLLVTAFGLSLGRFVIVSGALITAIVMLPRIRSRSKLMSAGFLAGLVAMGLSVVMGVLNEQPFGWSLLADAGRNFLWPLLAAIFITALLPYIERAFGVVTELSLLELGDVSHPLLQELVRRAPGTYNHSINVASIGEAAAEAIGRSGLLVRVGAYFHDIGKMLKPAYFVENQSDGDNRHETLMPAMSTLIIIAHVKDGADLARQHHLPEVLIDFIEQHHGTTRVEYFYQRASQQSEQEGEGSEVDESSFRYPGPKPQTIESAVLMLADAVEGASRALVEPTPKRLENVVRSIARDRLLDGQFDESGLDLRELRMVEDSLIKSLTSIHHGRVVYPSQETA